LLLSGLEVNRKRKRMVIWAKTMPKPRLQWTDSPGVAGELYDPLAPELVQARERARELCQDLNATHERDQEARRRILTAPSVSSPLRRAPSALIRSCQPPPQSVPVRQAGQGRAVAATGAQEMAPKRARGDGSGRLLL